MSDRNEKSSESVNKHLESHATDNGFENLGEVQKPKVCRSRVSTPEWKAISKRIENSLHRYMLCYGKALMEAAVDIMLTAAQEILDEEDYCFRKRIIKFQSKVSTEFYTQVYSSIKKAGRGLVTWVPSHNLMKTKRRFYPSSREQPQPQSSSPKLPSTTKAKSDGRPQIGKTWQIIGDETSAHHLKFATSIEEYQVAC